MSRAIQHGSTDVSLVVEIVDSTAGTPEEGVAHGSVTLWYRREGGAKTGITLAALTALTDAHSPGGWYEIDDGFYRVDIPDAAFASGADHVVVGGSATGMVVIGQRVALVAYDPQTVAVGASTFDPTTDEVDIGEVKGVAVTDITDFYAPDASLAYADTQVLLTRLTATRATYLDNLSAGAVATQTSVDVLQNAVRCSVEVPKEYQIPASGSERFKLTVLIYANDATGLEDPDSNTITVAVENPSGTSRDANLYDAVTGGSATTTMNRVDVGHYELFYESSDTDAVEQLNWLVSYTEASSPQKGSASTMMVAVATGGGFNGSDRTLLTTVHDDLADGGRTDLLIDSIQSDITGMDGTIWAYPDAGKVLAMAAAWDLVATAFPTRFGDLSIDVSGNVSINQTIPSADTISSQVQADLAASFAGVNSNIDTHDTDIQALIADVQTEVDALPTIHGKIDTIDGLIDAMKVIIDQFRFTIANQVDANTLSGSGSGESIYEAY